MGGCIASLAYGASNTKHSRANSMNSDDLNTNADEPRALALHERLAEEHGMSVVEIANLARATVQVMIDLVEVTGEAFVFQNRRERREPFGTYENDFDLAWINREVPAPDAQVDLIEALQQFKSDIGRGQMILNDKPSTADQVRVSDNHRAWFRFWSVRHPHPAMRAKFVGFLKTIEPLHRQNIKKARSMLQRRGRELGRGERVE